MTTVSIVLETDSVNVYDDITFTDCLAALARQSYPRELLELIVVDGGKVPALEEAVARVFPSAVVLDLPDGTKFEQKNVGMRAAKGEIVVFVDADCALAPEWLAIAVRELSQADAEVIGVQGITCLTNGFLSREISAFFYGTRSRRGDGRSGRLMTDNLALRRDPLQRFGFEHAEFSTVVDTLLLRRLTDAGYRILLCEDLRVFHSYPSGWEGVKWFLARAYGVGYYMVRGRQLEPALSGSALVRWGGLGWPFLAAGKCAVDLGQVMANRRALGARRLAVLPVLVVYEITLFIGGIGALLRLSAPRWA